MILTAACATAPSRDGACAANPAIEYRPEVMRAVADELNILDRVLQDTSQTRRVVGDFGIMRERQRAICNG